MDLTIEGKAYINGTFEQCCIGVTDGKISDNGKAGRMRRIEKSSLLMYMQKRKDKERQKGYDEFSREVDIIPDEH